MSKYDLRIEKLRELMRSRGLSYYIINTDDFHGSEYVGEYFKCREYFSGFTGSAGTLLIGLDKAYLYTDGRYFIQAADELKASDILLMKSGEPGVLKLSELLATLTKPGDMIGFDGRTASVSFLNTLSEACPKATLVTDIDLCDEAWEDRPLFPMEPAFELDLKYAGVSRAEKINSIREFMKSHKLDGMFLSALDETNWLLNIRGGDIAYCPMVMSYVYLSLDKTILFVHDKCLNASLKSSLQLDDILIKEYAFAYDYLKGLSGLKIGLDITKTNVHTLACLNACEVVRIESPVELQKAVKNAVELMNIRNAHIKDGVAVCKFLAMLSRLAKSGELFTKYTEKSLEGLLLSFREKGEGFISESFAPIIASGAHGAIVHYEATESSDKLIENNTLLLMDTGGHYFEGTTDITRTIGFGDVSDEMKYHYTLVLKGHLELMMLKFKKGLSGKEIDVYARKSLKEAGLDFNHGTGHGVGYLLNVHEGPQTISFRARREVPFKVGMVTSDEPGLYFEGKYGIRTENMILCVEGEKSDELSFEPLTFVPYDPSLIDRSLLNVEENEFLDYYNGCVYEKISPFLNDEEREWLRCVTK